MAVAKLKIVSTPYTYVLEWSSLGVRYIGARWAAGCHPSDLWNSYFTSSKYVGEFVEKNGVPDIILIDKVFDNAMDAMNRENDLLKKYDVKHNPAFLNKHVTGIWDRSDPAIEEKRRAALRGKSMSDENRARMSERMKGTQRRLGAVLSDESKLKMSLAAKGRKASEETRAKMSLAQTGKKHAIVSCPHCSKEGGLPAMKAWHFDRCKSKIR